ncbi:MAG: hypothetical protein IT573_07615 [Deltaproteobacteria bacterium]|nr:hypothetical protein [Deltaproteobacteria bacterium]
MKAKTNLSWSLLFACMLISTQARGQEPLKAAVADLCASPRLEEIIAAIECKRKACPDPDVAKDALYTRACTEVDPEAANVLGAVSVRDDGNLMNQRSVLRRVNESYDLIEALEVTRLEKPVNITTLEPCDCLAKIAAKTSCKVELCPKETQVPPPANPQPADEPRAEPAGKEVVPERTASSLQGGSFCSLNAHAAVPASGWAWLLLPLGNALWLRRRRCIPLSHG